MGFCEIITYSSMNEDYTKWNNAGIQFHEHNDENTEGPSPGIL